MKTDRNKKNRQVDGERSDRNKEDSPNMKLAHIIEEICSDEFSFEKEDATEKEDH